jgi:hypothetical protein
MAADEYDTLRGVSDWLVPDELLSPEGSVAAFAPVAAPAPGARVLDCAAGTGRLAVGLALPGSRSSPAMPAARWSRGRASSPESEACSWEELPDRDVGDFDVVFCVGNSITHAAVQG